MPQRLCVDFLLNYKLMKIEVIPQNPWQVNTIIIWDETKECVIIDPGCFDENEKQQVTNFIATNGLKPVKLLHTHLHLDHVFGTGFIADTYHLEPEAHPDDEFFINQTKDYAAEFGVTIERNPPKLGNYLNEGDNVTFGNSSLIIIHVPGHSPGGVAFYSEKDKLLVAGDVLFKDSIGRTDLPGGSFDTLLSNINSKLFTLPDNTTVYPGHGPNTTIGYEKESNPFLK